jgi:hypothetical protein
MSECSIHPSTPEKWIASMRDSLAKTLALLESRQVYLREPDQVFIEKSCVLLASLSPDNSFWKTCQQSFLTDSEPYSQTWPRWGMTQGGYAYAHPMSERRITETGGSHFATPNTLDSMPPKSPQALHKEATITRPGRSKPANLRDQVTQKYWPTPNASDNRDRGNMSNPSIQRRIKIGKQIGLSTAVKETSDGGTLNADWTEWLMAFPIGFTALKDSAMLRFRSKRQLPGNSSEANDD